MIYLSYYYDFELQGCLGSKQKNIPQQQQQLRVLLELSAIAAGKNRAFTCNASPSHLSPVVPRLHPDVGQEREVEPSVPLVDVAHLVEVDVRDGHLVRLAHAVAGVVLVDGVAAGAAEDDGGLHSLLGAVAVGVLGKTIEICGSKILSKGPYWTPVVSHLKLTKLVDYLICSRNCQILEEKIRKSYKIF